MWPVEIFLIRRLPFQVRAARNLLSAVTRLLILADMIDVHLLLKKLRRVEDDIEHLRTVSSQAGQFNWFFLPMFVPPADTALVL